MLDRIATPLCAADTVHAAAPRGDTGAGLPAFRIAVGVSLAAWGLVLAPALIGLG